MVADIIALQVGWMLHKTRVLCSIELRLSIKPPSPFFYHDCTGIITLIPIPHAAPSMSHVYLDWLGGGRATFARAPVKTIGAKSCLPSPLPPLPPPHPSSSSAREIDDSHLFFPPDSRVFAVPLIHPRNRPCNSVIHQQDLFLFALPCYTRNKSVCLTVEYT